MKKLVALVLVMFYVIQAKPVLIQYSTYLTDSQNRARTDITGRSMYFRLYDSQSGGNRIWEELQTVTANNGFVSVVLGSNTALPVRAIDTVSALWLEMEIAGEAVFARQRIYAGFYSLSAGIADTAVFSQNAAYAVQSRIANKADSLGNKPASAYALITDIPVISGNSDTSNYAKNADSLGGVTSFAYALKTDTILNAAHARNADSLGSVMASRYVQMNDSGNVGIGQESVPETKLKVKGNIEAKSFDLIGFNIDDGDSAGHYKGYDLYLTRNTALKIYVGRSYGSLLIIPAHPSYRELNGLISYCSSSSAGYTYTQSISTGSAIELTTGVLTGTTGTDGKCNVSVDNDGNIYIENRYAGGTISIHALFLGYRTLP